MPMPPRIFVSSRTPIWRSSILVLKTPARSFTSSRKSITSVRRKIEQHLIVVKGIFRIDQLHFQTVLADFFLTDLKRFFFFCLISGFLLVVALCRHAQHWL